MESGSLVLFLRIKAFSVHSTSLWRIPLDDSHRPELNHRDTEITEEGMGGEAARGKRDAESLRSDMGDRRSEIGHRSAGL